MVTYEAMNMMISFATLIIAIVPLGIFCKQKEMTYPAPPNV